MGFVWEIIFGCCFRDDREDENEGALVTNNQLDPPLFRQEESPHCEDVECTTIQSTSSRIGDNDDKVLKNESSGTLLETPAEACRTSEEIKVVKEKNEELENIPRCMSEDSIDSAAISLMGIPSHSSDKDASVLVTPDLPIPDMQNKRSVRFECDTSINLEQSNLTDEMQTPGPHCLDLTGQSPIPKRKKSKKERTEEYLKISCRKGEEYKKKGEEMKEQLLKDSGKKMDKHEGLWIAPQEDFLKINTDGTFKPDAKNPRPWSGAIGVTVRDSNGVCLKAFGRHLEVEDSIAAEAEGLLAGVKYAKEQGYKNVEFEFDMQTMENMLFYEDYPKIEPGKKKQKLVALKNQIHNYPSPPGGKHLYLQRKRGSNHLADICADLAYIIGEISYGYDGALEPTSEDHIDSLLKEATADFSKVVNDQLKKFRKQYKEDQISMLKVQLSGDDVVRGRELPFERRIRERRERGEGSSL